MTACESVDRYEHTRFTPISDTEFTYDAVVISIYSDEDRARWLNEEVEKFGMCPNGFDIVDRRIVPLNHTFLDASDREVIRGRCKQGG